MGNQAEKIFVVVDPSQDNQIALERAVITAKLRTPIAKLHLFIAVDMDHVDTSSENDRLFRDRNWYFEMVKPIEEANLEYEVDLCWSDDWYGSIMKASRKVGANFILIPLNHKPASYQRLFTESIWRLIRTAHCPVLVVQPGKTPERKVCLAAVNIQSHKPEYQALNTKIIERANWLTKQYGAELYLVNSYRDSLNYPDRARLVEMSGLDSDHILIRSGDPDDVIAEATRELDIDLLVLGARKRTSRWRGNTAERVIAKTRCDILILNNA